MADTKSFAAMALDDAGCTSHPSAGVALPIRPVPQEATSSPLPCWESASDGGSAVNDSVASTICTGTTVDNSNSNDNDDSNSDRGNIIAGCPSDHMAATASHPGHSKPQRQWVDLLLTSPSSAVVSGTAEGDQGETHAEVAPPRGGAKDDGAAAAAAMNTPVDGGGKMSDPFSSQEMLQQDGSVTEDEDEEQPDGEQQEGVAEVDGRKGPEKNTAADGLGCAEEAFVRDLEPLPLSSGVVSFGRTAVGGGALTGGNREDSADEGGDTNELVSIGLEAFFGTLKEEGEETFSAAGIEGERLLSARLQQQRALSALVEIRKANKEGSIKLAKQGTHLEHLLREFKKTSAATQAKRQEEEKAIDALMTNISLQLQRIATAERKLDPLKASTHLFRSEAAEERRPVHVTTQALNRAHELKTPVAEAVEAGKAAGDAAKAEELQAENTAVREENADLALRLAGAESKLRKYLLRSLVKKEHIRHLRWGFDALFFRGAQVIMAEQEELRRQEARRLEDARDTAAAAKAEAATLLAEVGALATKVAAAKAGACPAAAGPAVGDSDTGGLAAALPASLSSSARWTPTRDETTSVSAVDINASTNIVEAAAAAAAAGIDGGASHQAETSTEPPASANNPIGSSTYKAAVGCDPEAEGAGTADPKCLLRLFSDSPSPSTTKAPSAVVKRKAAGKSAGDTVTRASEVASESSSRGSVGSPPLAAEPFSASTPNFFVTSETETELIGQPPVTSAVSTQALGTAVGTPAAAITTVIDANPDSTSSPPITACASSVTPATLPAVGNVGGSFIVEPETSSTKSRASPRAASSTAAARPESSTMGAVSAASVVSRSAGQRNRATPPSSGSSPLSSTTFSSRARAKAKTSARAINVNTRSNNTAGNNNATSTATSRSTPAELKKASTNPSPQTEEKTVAAARTAGSAPAAVSRFASKLPATFSARSAGSTARAKPATSGPPSAISTATTSPSRTETLTTRRRRPRTMENPLVLPGTETPPPCFPSGRSPLIPLGASAPENCSNTGGESGADAISGSGKPVGEPLSQPARVDRTFDCRGTRCSRDSGVPTIQSLVPSAPGRAGVDARKGELLGTEAGAVLEAGTGAGVVVETLLSRTASGRSTRASSRATGAAARAGNQAGASQWNTAWRSEASNSTDVARRGSFMSF